MSAINNLKLLPLEDWHLVRDVCLPITPQLDNSGEPNGSFEADIENAVAYVGSPAGMRLYDPNKPETMSRLLGLFTKALPHLEKQEHRFRLEHDGVAFRAQVGRTPTQLDLMLRALPTETPGLADLKLNEGWKALLLDQELLNGGLILICAPNGQGKTTTASAIVKSRLMQYAGYANTYEDVCELPLNGFWGEGKCVQRPVQTEAGRAGSTANFDEALQDALRQFPAFNGGGTILFVGEIGDSATAAATIKAAGNGHLVIATVHAQSIPLALRRMITLASGSKDHMDPDSVREMLAECLRCVLYQRLAWEKDTRNLRGWERAEVKGDILYIPDHSCAAAQALRSNQVEQLQSISKKQTQYLRDVTQPTIASQVKAGLPGTEPSR